MLAIRERVLGAEHPDSLTSRNNLAEGLHAQGRDAEAEQEHRAVLAIRERVREAWHPDIFTSCHNLALCLQARMKTGEAIAFARRAWEGRKRGFGDEHLSTRKALSLLEELERK